LYHEIIWHSKYVTDTSHQGNGDGFPCFGHSWQRLSNGHYHESQPWGK
jgi:hypothetical protein